MSLGLVVLLQDLNALFIEEPALDVDVRIEVTAEDSLREVGQKLLVGAQVEDSQVLRELQRLRIQIVQVVEVMLAIVLVGQLGIDVLFQLAVVDIQHELGHHLLRIREDLKRGGKKN